MARSERGSVAILMVYPGKLAMVGGIAPACRLDSAEELRDTSELLRSLCDTVRDEVELIQAVTFPQEFEADFDLWRRRCYQLAGLKQVATLKQYSFDYSKQSEDRLVANQSAVPSQFSIQFEAWQAELHAELVRVVDQTYQGTFDVPELNGVRSTAATLDGYASAGWQRGTDRDWWLVRDGSQGIGCLLLCRHSSFLAELLYLGLIPEYRRRGLSKTILEYMLQWGSENGIKRILLAVDARNKPALRLYERMGFEATGTAEAWF
jgi:GNAT superfamily N-acetyltransferase